MAKRAVDIGIADLAGLGRRAAREAAETARDQGLRSFGAAEVVRDGRKETRFVTVAPDGKVEVGDRVPVPPRAKRGKAEPSEAVVQNRTRRYAVTG